MAVKSLDDQELRSALDGIIPFVVGTCDAEGTANITFMSRLYYSDRQHVAISRQFMNKTWRNLQSNNVLIAFVTNPDTMSMWKLRLEFVEEITEGAVFEEMEMQLMALATPDNISFSLHSALLCRVISIEKVFNGV